MFERIDELTFETSYKNNKFRVSKKGPYDFWYIDLERGTPPEHLTGAYSTVELAKTAVEHYIEQQKLAVKPANNKTD